MRRSLLALLVVGACGGSDSPSAPDAAPRPDAASPDAAQPEVDAGADLPPWSAELPPAADSIGPRRGLVPARGIVHLHSPYSHDACDEHPRDEKTGAVDESCLADLRAGLCATRIDYAAITDHDDSMAEEEFDDLFLVRGDDVRVGGASRIQCDGGHQVLLFVGGENELMPIFLDRHPDGDAAARHELYNASSPEAVATFRALGGLVVIPHSEQRTTEVIRGLAPDGMEIYNLHANIDPDIRRDYLGLPPDEAVEHVLQFLDTSPEGPEPDLALLSFLEPLTVAIQRWDELLGEGRRVFGTAGTDAHQNALPIPLRDGERGDSYRRMLRWFSNIALVADPTDPDQVEQAVQAGRSFVAFELFGTPAGFDVRAEGPDRIAEIGDQVDPDGDFTLELQVPTVYQLDPALPAPAIRGRILRVDADGTHELAAGEGPALSAPMDTAGAYRVEILIAPHHHGPRLGNLGTEWADREQVWIYSNPIYASSGVGEVEPKAR